MQQMWHIVLLYYPVFVVTRRAVGDGDADGGADGGGAAAAAVCSYASYMYFDLHTAYLRIPYAIDAQCGCSGAHSGTCAI